jgi:hypothetical protein
MESPRVSALNDSQRHRLVVTCQYVDRLRAQLVRMLDGQGLLPTPQRFALRHSLVTHLLREQITASAMRALERARERRQAGQDAVAAELNRIDALRQRLDRVTEAV